MTAFLLEKVVKELLPKFRAKWKSRNNRSLPESIQFTLSKFDRIWRADSSVLESLFKKLKSLEDVPIIQDFLDQEKVPDILQKKIEAPKPAPISNQFFPRLSLPLTAIIGIAAVSFAVIG